MGFKKERVSLDKNRRKHGRVSVSTKSLHEDLEILGFTLSPVKPEIGKMTDKRFTPKMTKRNESG